VCYYFGGGGGGFFTSRQAKGATYAFPRAKSKHYRGYEGSACFRTQKKCIFFGGSPPPPKAKTKMAQTQAARAGSAWPTDPVCGRATRGAAGVGRGHQRHCHAPVALPWQMDKKYVVVPYTGPPCTGSLVTGVRCGFCLSCKQRQAWVVPRSACSSTAAAPEPPRPSLRPGLPALYRLEQEQQGTRTTSYTEKENLERDSVAQSTRNKNNQNHARGQIIDCNQKSQRPSFVFY
jgi:hypothetical protein